MSENPLLDTLADMTTASVERVGISDEALLLVRLAALIAVDAPAASYALNLRAAIDTRLTLEDARSVLIAVAPIVGVPKVVSATSKLAQALGLPALTLEDL